MGQRGAGHQGIRAVPASRERDSTYQHLEQGCGLGGLRIQKPATGETGIQEPAAGQTECLNTAAAGNLPCTHLYAYICVYIYKNTHSH